MQHQNNKRKAQTNLLLKICQTLQTKTHSVKIKVKIKTNFRKLNGFLNKNKTKNQ